MGKECENGPRRETQALGVVSTQLFGDLKEEEER